jgi:tRNA pseudouridine65 synthase
MFRILFRDDHLVAIDKPAGWLVHRSDIDRHENRIVVQALRDQLGGRHVYPVHRLDKGTSGVLLCAFAPETVRELAAQFEAGDVEKTYHAIVRGWPPECGEIDHPLRRDHDDYGRHLPDAKAQPALTRYRRLANAEIAFAVDRYPTTRYALVELHPVTGRRHQLRRHMKHIAHPIIGDATHGKGVHNRAFAAQFGIARLMLACVRLTFDHPVTGVRCVVEVSAGDAFSRLLAEPAWRLQKTTREP